MPRPLLKVNEIFYSLQGEGPHTGMAAVFLRLAGCRMNCPFCDTKYAAAQGQEMTDGEIISALEQYPCRNVIITGGEPTEQDFAPLARTLKKRGWTVHMESNGAQDADVSDIDFLVVSPKKHVHEYTDLSEIEKYFPYANAHTAVCLQPESNKQENIDLCVKLVKQHPFLRLSLQTHKLANIR